MPADHTTVRQLPGGNTGPAHRNLAALMLGAARDRGHAPFLTFYDDTTGERTELSYATFDNWVSKTANMLVEEVEVGRGGRVATLLGNHWTALVVAFACWKAGCCLVPLGIDADPKALAAAGAGAVFVREDLLGRLPGDPGQGAAQVVAVGTGMGARLSGAVDPPGQALAYGEEVLAFADDYDDPDVGLDDDALLVLPAAGSPTPAAVGSPTPAAVRLTQGNLLAAAEAVGAWGLGRDDRLLCAQAAHRVDGLALGHLGPFAAGASVVLTRNYDHRGLWQRVADERVTLLLLAPDHLDHLPEASPPEALRGALVPAGAAPGALAEARTRLPVATGHGLAEATCASTLSPAGQDPQSRAWLEAAPGREAGAVTARAAVAALDADGAARDHGTEGLLAVRGPVVMAGYDGRGDLDEQVFATGWFATAQRGFTDVGPDGATHVFVTGHA